MARLRNLILCLLLAIFNAGLMAEDIPRTIFLANEEYPPYTSENLKDYGVTSAIVTAAFRLEGIKTQYQFLPSARAYYMTRLGEFDGTVPWAKREGREQYFFYSDPVIEVDKEYFYSLKETSLAWDADTSEISDLENVKIATVIGYNYSDKLQNAEKSHQLQTVRLDSLKQGFSMLLAGRVDTVVSKKIVAEQVLIKDFTQEQRAKLTLIPVSNNKSSHDYLLISRQAKHAEYFLDAFNHGLKKLHASGEYQHLMNDLANGVYSN
jgi:polar amino acid transport system substrate-binding protein